MNMSAGGRMVREVEKQDTHQNVFWMDAISPAFILVLVTSYFLPWVGAVKIWGASISSKSGFYMWSRILSKPASKHAALVFLILLLFSAATVLILFTVRRFVLSPTGRLGNRALLGWLSGGAALTTALSSLVPAFMITSRFAGRPPEPGFFLNLLAGLGLVAAGIISIIFSRPKQKSKD